MQQKGKLGRWQGAGLLATTLLGTSVFILPQITVEIAGKNAIWAWTILTISMLPIALVFAKLCAEHPHAGGPANFVAQAFGQPFGCAIGMSFLLVVPIGAPAALIMTYQFVDSIFAFHSSIGLFIQYGFLALIYALNRKGISFSANIQLLLTTLICIVIVGLCMSYFLSSPADLVAPRLNETSAISIMPAAALAFWSFLGIEAMAHLSTEFKKPKEDMTPAIIIGTLTVGIIYICCTFLLIHLNTTSSLAIIDVFNTLFGNYGEIVIGFLGIAGGLATINVYMASCCKLMQSFAQQGVLPKLYDRENAHGVASTALRHLALLMFFVLTVSHGLSLDLETLVGLCNGVFIAIYATSMLSALELLSRVYRGFIFVGITVCLVLAASLAWKMIYAALLICLLVPLMKYWRQSKLTLCHHKK
ncbi:L-methionine/branched-chain amino acid transporter [Agaribacter flavus]|uniref:L-methionine/branched-chain amino acid transporter n=1 Tax=Agaribacter flavus TaxID=1902781 RepID=A0ABV7FP59_9ALTE